MKSKRLVFAFAALASSLPCAAQTSPAQLGNSQVRSAPSNSPEMQAYINLLFQHAGSTHGFLTPQEKSKSAAILARLNEMERRAADALRARDFTAAEAAYRSLIEADSLSGDAHYGLGDALAGQGKTTDAIAAYQVGIYWPTNAGKELKDIPLDEPSRGRLAGCPNQTAATSWMRCALLLSQAGQGAEAGVIYKEALVRVPGMSDSGASLSFDTETPAPETFQAAAHIALGLCLTFDSTPDHEQAMREFDTALRLQPASAVANYYYGYGWQQLDPKSHVRAALAQKAKAALQQAAAFGEGDVKKAAVAALTGLK